MKIKKTVIAGVGLLTILAGIALNDKPMTWNEYEATVAILNYEVEKLGKFELQNVKDKDLLPELKKIILARPIDSEVEIAGEKLSPTQYKELRQKLISKIK